MVAAVGIAPTSPPLQGGANLSQLNSHRKLVPPRGNAPRSFGYRPIALLLSYGGVMPAQVYAILCGTSPKKGGQPRACSPSTNDYGSIRLQTGAGALVRLTVLTKLAPPPGIAPGSHRLTGGLHTLCIERNRKEGTPGRICTCVVPFRRRMPRSARPREPRENGRAPRLRSGYLPREHSLAHPSGCLWQAISRPSALGSPSQAARITIFLVPDMPNALASAYHEMVSPAGVAPASSAFAKRRSSPELRGNVKVAVVTGAAPAVSCLTGR